MKRYLQNPDLIATQLKLMRGAGADPQLVRDREMARKAADRLAQGTKRLIRRLRDADDDLAAIIERELLEAEREKRQILDTLADLDSKLTRQQQASADLNSLYGYCRMVETERATFAFAEKRLALEALGAQVRASGRELGAHSQPAF